MADSAEEQQRGDSKVESNYSPEIPDRGKTSDIPGLPSGAVKEEKEKEGKNTKKNNKQNFVR